MLLSTALDVYPLDRLLDDPQFITARCLAEAASCANPATRWERRPIKIQVEEQSVFYGTQRSLDAYSMQKLLQVSYRMTAADRDFTSSPPCPVLNRSDVELELRHFATEHSPVPYLHLETKKTETFFARDK